MNPRANRIRKRRAAKRLARWRHARVVAGALESLDAWLTEIMGPLPLDVTRTLPLAQGERAGRCVVVQRNPNTGAVVMWEEP